MLVRLGYLYDTSDCPTFLAPIVDSFTYDGLARDFVAGKGMTDGFFWQPFFYPFFLSTVYYLTDGSMLAAKLVQALVGSLACLLTYLLGCKLGNRWTGMLAAIITALYGPLIFIEGELLGEGWAAFCSVLLVLLLVRVGEPTTKSWYYLCLGLCGALAVLARPTFVPFLAAACLWLVVTLRHRIAWGLLLRRLALVGMGFAVVAVPVAIQKHRVTGRFGILPESGGLNTYIGNNPAYDKTITARPGVEWDQLCHLPDRSGIHDPRDKPAFYYHLVMQYVTNEPAAFGKGLFVKSAQFFSAREIPRNVSIYLFRRWSAMLSMLTWKVGPFGFPFGVLLPLAVLGVIRHYRQIPVPMILFVVLHALSVILVFVSGRYRVPMVPVVTVLAAWGCQSLAQMVRTRRWPQFGGTVAALAAIGVSISLPGPFVMEAQNYEAELHCDLGSFYEGRHANTGRALAEFQQAIELDPDYAEAYYNHGKVCDETGNSTQAIQDYTRAIELKPDYAMAYHNRGTSHYKQHDLDAAIRDYTKAIELKPDLALAYSNRGYVYREMGDSARAIQDCTRAIELTPHLPEGYNNRAMAYYFLKEYDQAWADVEKCKQLGGKVNPEFIKALTQASSRPG